MKSNTAPVLESLGKTRKYKNNGAMKNMSKAVKVTQDDATVMSGLTANQENERGEKETDGCTLARNKGKEAMPENDDEATLMSNCSTIQDTSMKTNNCEENQKRESNIR